jgi:hypothetical protein
MAVTDCRADLISPKPLKGRKVNTPEMTVSVPVERLQNTTRGDTVSDPGLDNLFWLQVARETPYGPHQTSIAVIPELKALRARPNPLCFQFADYLGP